MKKTQKKFWRFKYMFLTVLVLTIGICAYFGFKGYAADSIYIQLAGVDVTNKVVEQRQKELQLDMKSSGDVYDDPSIYEITWSIEGSGSGVIASVSQGSSQSIGLVTALSPGRVRITVTVRDKRNPGTILDSTGCDIDVIFAIDTTIDDSIYKNIYEDSTEKSLVLYAGEDDDSIKQLALNFGDAASAQWTSANTEVVTVNQWTGIVQAVGAGSTTITASYTPEGHTTTYQAVLSVYVIPKVTDDYTKYENGDFQKGRIVTGMNRDEILYLDTNFDDNNTTTLNERVVWVIKQDDGGGQKVIANSLSGGIRSDLISLEPEGSRSSMLSVQAKAGKYYIEFYTAGTYQSETKKTKAYTPTIVELNVYANFSNYNETLIVGDSYHLANAFNLTVSDFIKYFYEPDLSYGGGIASNYVSYSSTNTTVTTKGAATINVKVTTRDSYISTVRNLTDPNSSVFGYTVFNITLNIMDSFGLDRANCIIYEKQQLQLNAILSGISSGSIEWSSSNTAYVTVDGQGKITGIKSTKGLPDIIITASLKNEYGAIIKNATCSVKVESAATGMKLTPSELSMKVGENATVKAEFSQTVTVAPLIWTSKDSSIVTVEPAADGKSAVVTAKKGGDTTIIVTNTLNNEFRYVEVKVLMEITSISFTQASVSAKKLPNSDKLTLNVNYSPKDANSTELVWNSLDSGIATIEGSGVPKDGAATGLVTMKKPGEVYLTVAPKYNPSGIIATCMLTVLEPATDMTIQPTEVTLNAKYGVSNAETKQITYTLTPSNAITNVTYTPDDSSVAEVSSTGLITAKKAGETYIRVQSEEGLIRNCKVKVLQPCESISFSPLIYTMNTGETYAPNLVKKPADTTDTFTWKSYDASIATVDANGRISAKKAGETFIQAVAKSGTFAILQLKVQDGVKGVALNYSAYTVEKGSSFDLIPKFTPETAYDKSVKWNVSNSSVVTTQERSADGIPYLRVTGKQGGVTIISVTTNDGGFVAACIVNVKEKSTKVTVSPATKYLKLGSSFTVKATVSSATATNKKVTWSSNKKKVATVSSSGVVKGKKLGTAYITAKAKDGSGASARCKVIVVRKVTSVRLNKYTAKLLVVRSFKLKRYISPKKASVKSVTWSSSNNSIATVSAGGRVLGLSEGMVRIRAKANDGSGKYAICLVNVVEPVAATGVSVSQSEIMVARGRHIQSGIAVSPANSTDSIKYFSDNKAVATVDKRGKIKTKRTGQATIYGKTSNGKLGYTDVLVVAMNRGTLKMRQYDKETLSVNEINTGVTWHSSNPLIASVTNGTVLGRRPGKTTIYATVRGIRLPCRVRITKIR